MYKIKRAAELVGVTESTLRAWERRYGLELSRRTEAGYRLYDDVAVGYLRLLHDLTLEGWSVRAAAEEVRLRSNASAPAAASTAPVDDQALVRVAREYDAAMLSRVLDDQFGTASFEAVVDGWLLPALRAVGAAWIAGEITVAGEHLVAHGVARRLAAAYDAAADNRFASDVVIGLPHGSRHDLGLLAFAIAARRAGLATMYLGPDVPVDDWVAVVGSRRVRAVVLAAATKRDAEAVAETVAAVETASPGLLVAVGGGAQDLAPASCLRLGHEIGPSAALLARQVGRG